MLNSNATCQVKKRTGHDAYGQPTFAPTVVTERCAIVKIKTELTHTTVRADGSQSRGHGDEFVASHKIHLDSTTIAELGDQVIVAGIKMKVTSKQARYDVLGPLDHYEIGGELWV